MQKKMRRDGGRRARGQQVLAFPATHGGARRGAGRKRKGRASTPHRKRLRFRGAKRGGAALHVTLRVEKDVADLRRWRIFAAFVEILSKAARVGFRVIEFSLQAGHVHLIVEAKDWEGLSNAIRGLEIRLARRINAIATRRGRAISDRYHVRVLETPTDARHAIVYVLQNAAKHGRTREGLAVDPLSSAGWFTGWKEPGARRAALSAARMALARRGRVIPATPVSEPETWLLSTGWKRKGLISVRERPAYPNRVRKTSHSA